MCCSPSLLLLEFRSITTSPQSYPNQNCLCSMPTGFLLSVIDQSQKSESLFDIEADSSFSNIGSETMAGHGDALNDLKPSRSDIYDSIGELVYRAEQTRGRLRCDLSKKITSFCLRCQHESENNFPLCHISHRPRSVGPISADPFPFRNPLRNPIYST